jgi:transposase
MKLTDGQWAIVEPLLPLPPTRPDGRGRPRRGNREILDGVLWILRTGAQWDELPDRFLPKSTCHDRFQEWNRQDTIADVLKALAEDLVGRGRLDLSECFIDATFASAKKGDRPSERPSEVKARRSWQWRTLEVLLSPRTWRALPRTRRRWLRRRWPLGSPDRLRRALLATELTTVIRLTPSFSDKASI